MSDDRTKPSGKDRMDETVFIQQEKRRSRRKLTRASFTMSLSEGQIEGVGSNISSVGAYFVTCDEITVQLEIRGEAGERKVFGKIKRIEDISDGTRGIAIEFDTRLPEM